MRCARALPTSADACGRLPQCFLSPPRCWVDFPERMSGRTSSAARTPGTPSIIMSPDPRPWTQIRLGAGTRNDIDICRTFSGRQQMT